MGQFRYHSDHDMFMVCEKKSMAIGYHDGRSSLLKSEQIQALDSLHWVRNFPEGNWYVHCWLN